MRCDWRFFYFCYHYYQLGTDSKRAFCQRPETFRRSCSPFTQGAAGFVLRNSSDQDVKNINILCEFYGADGKFLDRKTWLLSGKIPAGETMQHNSVSERFVNTRAKGLQCSLVDFDIAKAPSFVLHRASGGHGGQEAEGGHGAPAEH